MKEETRKKIAETKRLNMIRRYKKIKERFNEIYRQAPKPLQYEFDAIVMKLANEFGVSIHTIKHALKSDIENL
ncbi:hypothetical protein [Sediminitomix flava]|uniref:Uncharacterized protein n=1 Tax=Sediminitomix flava TaxID=379075 RepID=A0A315ZA52_SEDFL|nr:hypothetical protein [Sediminitomix flava]PWJ41084.1 hypothetical protein BC781_104359 [Sediminitomix flava]